MLEPHQFEQVKDLRLFLEGKADVWHTHDWVDKGNSEGRFLAEWLLSEYNISKKERRVNNTHVDGPP